jgi:hypothetical protein
MKQNEDAETHGRTLTRPCENCDAVSIATLADSQRKFAPIVEHETRVGMTHEKRQAVLAFASKTMKLR